MQQKSLIGPRGWALLTLLGGVFLAAPFLRQPSVDDASLTGESPKSTASEPSHFFAPEIAPTSTASAPSDPMSDDFSGFLKQIVPPAGMSPTALPAWAPTRSPMDQLISQGTAPPWQSDMSNVSTIKPLEPWASGAGTDQPQPALPSTFASAWPDASSVPVADSLPALSRIPGSLAGTAQQVRPATTPRLQPPANQTPAKPQYVFQPGFHGTSKQ